MSDNTDRSSDCAESSTRGPSRRTFIRHCAMGAGFATVGGLAVKNLLFSQNSLNPYDRLKVGPPSASGAKLAKYTREARWYDASPRSILCELCPQECVLEEEGARGNCRIREARGGKLYTLTYGSPCAVHVDPMEKKPLFHYLPGTPILSIATAGCNLKCLNCQNWQISQSNPEDVRVFDLPPEKLIQAMEQNAIPAIAYTYSEPIVFYEYTYDTAEKAREKGLKNVLVTAGYICENPLRELCRVIDAANVDLKSFSNATYKRLNRGRLQPVLDGLVVMKEEGVWVEITRLIVPEHSDDLADIRKMCRWIARELGPDVPLHLSRFHPAYQLENLPDTPVEIMEQSWEIAREEGLKYVYIGNVPGKPEQNTYCPRCGELLIRRRGYQILENNIKEGKCPSGHIVAGVWT